MIRQTTSARRTQWKTSGDPIDVVDLMTNNPLLNHRNCRRYSLSIYSMRTSSWSYDCKTQNHININDKWIVSVISKDTFFDIWTNLNNGLILNFHSCDLGKPNVPGWNLPFPLGNKSTFRAHHQRFLYRGTTTVQNKVRVEAESPRINLESWVVGKAEGGGWSSGWSLDLFS